MFKAIKKNLYLIGILMFGGCTGVPATMSLNQAILTIQKDMISAKTIPVANYGTWAPDQKMRFELGVQTAQCTQNTSDPIIPTIAGNVTLDLQGTFSKTGSFSVSGAATGIPGISLGGSTTQSKGQGINVPVAFAQLSALPSVETAISVTRVGTLLSQQGTLRDSVGNQIVEEQTQFSQYINGLIKGFDKASCPTPVTLPKGQVNEGSAFLGLHAPKK